MSKMVCIAEKKDHHCLTVEAAPLLFESTLEVLGSMISTLCFVSRMLDKMFAKRMDGLSFELLFAYW